MWTFSIRRFQAQPWADGFHRISLFNPSYLVNILGESAIVLTNILLPGVNIVREVTIVKQKINLVCLYLSNSVYGFQAYPGTIGFAESGIFNSPSS